MTTIERVQITSREEWLGWRPQFVNASEVAIVCGEAGFGSLAELYAEKKGLRPPLIDNGALKRGRWGEAAVFEALLEERPEWEVRRGAVHVRDLDRRMACTPDGFARRPDRDGIGIVQAKVVARSIFRQKWLDDPDSRDLQGAATPPTTYRLQTHTEVMLNELAWGVLAVVINGEWDWTFRLFDIDRDQNLDHLVCSNVHRFWTEHLDPGIMPPFEPQRDAELVRALYPRDDGTEIDLTTDNRALTLVEDLTETSAALKRLNMQETAIKTELQGKLGTHTFGRLADGRRLSWKLQHRNGHTVPPSDFRVFRILKPEAQR